MHLGRNIIRAQCFILPASEVVCDVLAGIELPWARTDRANVLEIEDEQGHVFQSASTINRIIRDTLSETIRETITRAVRRELNYHRGRLDDI
ncbi:MAG: hypothetical protein ABIU05_20870 [Nitrospirales bacterium]